jgi:hypothetical protein
LGKCPGQGPEGKAFFFGQKAGLKGKGRPDKVEEHIHGAWGLGGFLKIFVKGRDFPAVAFF